VRFEIPENAIHVEGDDGVIGVDHADSPCFSPLPCRCHRAFRMLSVCSPIRDSGTTIEAISSWFFRTKQQAHPENPYPT
jgi:hypothetical protein